MSHKKRSKVESPLGVQLGLIITPMLDMSFQILAFFIMTYHPAAMEGHIGGTLAPPEQDVAKKSKDNTPAVPLDVPPVPKDPKDTKEALDDVVTVEIKAHLADPDPEKAKKQKDLPGTPRQVKLYRSPDPKKIRPDVPEETQEVLPGSDDNPFPKVVANLEKRLKEIGGGKGSKLKIKPDGELRYGYVLQVYDAAKRAGFDEIHFVPPPVKGPAPALKKTQ